VGDDPKAKVGPVFAPPSKEWPLGTDGGRREHARPPHRRRAASRC
jgi:hypothetical protein